MGSFRTCGNLGKLSVSQRTDTKRYYNPVKLHLLGAASVMPAEKYGFKLDPGADGLRAVDQPLDRAQLPRLVDVRGEPKEMIEKYKKSR